jgi:hypothetical protein
LKNLDFHGVLAIRRSFSANERAADACCLAMAAARISEPKRSHEVLNGFLPLRRSSVGRPGAEAKPG